MEPKLVSKGKEKDGGEGKVDKLKAHWTTSNKKLFMDLALKRFIPSHLSSDVDPTVTIWVL